MPCIAGDHLSIEQVCDSLTTQFSFHLLPDFKPNGVYGADRAQAALLSAGDAHIDRGHPLDRFKDSKQGDLRRVLRQADPPVYAAKRFHEALLREALDNLRQKAPRDAHGLGHFGYVRDAVALPREVDCGTNRVICLSRHKHSSSSLFVFRSCPNTGLFSSYFMRLSQPVKSIR